jgi:pyruvate-formate lyase-activating enzyme
MTPSPDLIRERFKPALLTIQAARSRYIAINKLTVASPDYEDPGAFVMALRARLFPDEGQWPEALQEAFFDWAAGERPPCKLALVMAAIDALERGRREEAVERARRALTLIQNNLHIQKVYRKALGAAEPPLEGRFCRAPFENIETAPGGEVYFCCPAWLPVPIGRLGHGDAEAVWNSPTAQEIRRSIHDGDYRYCSRIHCPKLSAGTRPVDLPLEGEVKNREHKALIAGRSTRMERRPRKIILSHDRSCNLSCPSCRTSTILARKDEQDRLNRLFDEVLAPMLEDARRLHVTASGDPFGSAHFRYVLKQTGQERFPALRLDLQTNGILFDEAAWEDLGLADRIDKVAVSIDAARPETYAVVRRGGDFERLMGNLAFLAKKRRQGQIRQLRLDFVVQAMNYREMPEMAEIASRFAFDGLKFQMIRNWNTYSPEDFARHHIGSPGHPEHEAFLAVLGDERLTAPTIEFWGMGVAPAPRA